MNAIELIDVSKTIKGRPILQNISLSLPKGLIYGFVGPNGSGKSMLFRIISGLVIPTSGQIRIFEDYLHDTISFPKSIGIILEKPGFLEHYSGIDNLKFLAGIQNKISIEEIRLTLVRVGLDPDDRRMVKTYSLGMKQKLAIAQAVMEHPKLILLDEPMNGLDENSVPMIYKIVREEKERGATILMTSHHKEDIEALCDDVYQVSDGMVKRNQESENQN
ncbi:ABC transporter ATP-binding protein [Sporolactobacillus sp. STCC-11]|uniref:ABC transporter ATP-binding protein n=1 Tax=Sporolactobacillus caesalpiniae TaxID=3230362 RepID=UPI00339B9D5C